MTLNEYQKQAQRTSDTEHNKILNGVLGMSGEAGECADAYKKAVMQGHPLSHRELAEEAGDCLWYVAELASGIGMTLEEIAQMNIDKLWHRYPTGFDSVRSINR